LARHPPGFSYSRKLRVGGRALLRRGVASSNRRAVSSVLVELAWGEWNLDQFNAAAIPGQQTKNPPIGAADRRVRD
jgi:hypothetical protein